MIIIDYETKSNCPIEYGLIKYASFPSTEVLVLGWLDTNDRAVHQWFPGDPIPEWVDSVEPVAAFNAAFEYEIGKLVPTGIYLEKRRFVDVQALCARYGLPRNLHDASYAMGLDNKKMEGGNALVKKFCIPPYQDAKGEEWATFLEYNRMDVLATRDLLAALPASTLSAFEQEVFELNWEINSRGIPIDKESAHVIYNTVQTYLQEHNNLLPELTDGQVTKITQIGRILKFCESRGCRLPDLRAQTVAETLQEIREPTVIQVLEMRQANGLSSIGKYKRILDMSYDGRIFYNSSYYGAHTGRITGSGFQLLNLPRDCADKPDEVIMEFHSGTICNKEPILAARSLVRAMIKAPEGRKLIVGDYSSIEYVMLAWLADDHDALANFERGVDQYKLLAASPYMYNKPYDDVTKDERQIAKYGILGCGYGLGVKGFVGYAKRFGFETTIEQARFVVEGYRKQYKKVKNLWYDLDNAAKWTVATGEQTDRNGVVFSIHGDWLQMMLPSKRAMYYRKPIIREGMYGPAVYIHGTDQVTHRFIEKQMTPGKWVENVVQALSRDLLHTGMMAVESKGYTIIGSIYDEIICEVDKEFGSSKEFTKLMETRPDWAPTLPVKVQAYEAERYKK